MVIPERGCTCLSFGRVHATLLALDAEYEQGRPFLAVTPAEVAVECLQCLSWANLLHSSHEGTEYKS